MHHTRLIGALASALIVLPAPASAQEGIGGRWHVTGDIDSKAFAVDCTFEPKGAQFGGECIDVSTGEAKARPGKIHKLTQGSVSGEQVRWIYPVKVMIMSIDINFVGTLNGNRMAGSITAKGRQGRFFATRA